MLCGMTIIEGPWRKSETISFYPTPVWSKEPDRLFAYDENFKRVECKEQPLQSCPDVPNNNKDDIRLDKELQARYEEYKNIPWQSCEIKGFDYSDEATPVQEPEGFLGTRFWSRAPGKFVDVETGFEKTGLSFEGTVQDWYETLVEVIFNAGNLIHKRTMRFSENRITVNYDTRTILEHTRQYRPVFVKGEPFIEQTGGVVGVLCDRFQVVLDPSQPNDIIKVDTADHPETCWVDVKVLDLCSF